MLIGCYLSFFFFQAEDGIRDRDVTGVQTCALPIWRALFEARRELKAGPQHPGAAQDDLQLVLSSRLVGCRGAGDLELSPRLVQPGVRMAGAARRLAEPAGVRGRRSRLEERDRAAPQRRAGQDQRDRKSTRLNSSHITTSYA